MRVFFVRCLFLVIQILSVSLAPSLAAAKQFKWKCDYPVVVNANGVFRDQDYSVEFDIDDATGRALVIRGGPPHEVEFLVQAGGITFLEKTPEGTVRITTIDEAGSAVDSRHILLRGRLIPSQSYGRCAVKQDNPE